MIDMGFLIKQRRPLMPAYLLRQPADHSRTAYSVPKNSTSTISCGEQCKHRARVTWIHWYSRTSGWGSRYGVISTKHWLRRALRLISTQESSHYNESPRCTIGYEWVMTGVWGGDTSVVEDHPTTQEEKWILITCLMTAHIETGSMDKWLKGPDEIQIRRINSQMHYLGDEILT